MKNLLFLVIVLNIFATVPCVRADQAAIFADEPSIYWTMGKLTPGEDAVLAEVGEDVNGAPLNAELRADGDLPMLVDGIVPTADDGAILFDASQGQSLFVADSPFTNDTPDNLGVTNRTYELWFQARNLPEAGADNRQVIFEEGGITRGLAIYLDGTQGEDPTEAELYIMTTNLAEEPWGGEAGPGATDPDFAVHATIQKGEIYHLVYVIDKPDDVRENLNGDLIGYLNGEEFGRVSESVGLWFDHTDDAGIGRPYSQTVFHDGILPGANATGLYFFDGVIDEFAIYDGRSLTAEQVKNHYLAGLGTEEIPIVDFIGDAALVGVGESLTLSWEVNAFETLTINNDVGDVSGNTADGKGSITVNPAETTSYILTATQGEVQQSRSVAVHVGVPGISQFVIDGASIIRAGGSATLSWVTEGETKVEIAPDLGDVSDTSFISVSPASTTTYTLTATNEFGSSTAEVTIELTTDLIPDLGWSANDLDGGDVLEWLPTHNNTDNDGILWNGGGEETVEFGVTNFANITAWVNSPGLSLTGNPNDSWQDGLGGSVTQDNVSWELVFRPGDFDDKHTLFNTGGNGDGTAFVLEGSLLDFRFQDANNDEQRVIASFDLAEIGSPLDFYHVVGTADIDSANTGTATLFVNGELRNTVTSAGTINDWDGGDLAELGTGNNIPGGNTFSPDPFTGDIALFNYYEGLLLAEEQVADLYRAQSGDTGFKISQFEIVSGANGLQSAQLTWDSLSGRFYDVETSADLSSASWQPFIRALPSDPDPATSTSASVEILADDTMQYYRVRTVGPPPFLETSFEDGMGEWTVAGDGTQWEFGPPTSGPGAAVTGANVAATGLAGDYADGTMVQLLTPVIDPGETQRVKLEFWHYLETAEGDGGQVSVLEADGTTVIERLDPFIGGEGGNLTEWTQTVLRLPTLEPARPFVIQFALLSADDGDPENGTGWMIDDVRVGK